MSKFVKYDNRIYMRHWFRWYVLMDKYAAAVQFEPKAAPESLEEKPE